MIRVFESFAGYGGGSFALRKAGIPFELVGFSEIDKYAVKCFEQNHETNYILHGSFLNYGDITKIDWSKVPNFDLLIGGFPCQDISIAGKQDLSKGRSVLVFELIKALKEKQPKYFLFENVSAIEQEKFSSFLREAENGMKDAGYKVYRKCLNSKNYGIPQNRERVWFVGYRKDIAPEFGFNPFPVETGRKLMLKDLLEENVNEKYFLSENAVKNLLSKERKINKRLNNETTKSAYCLLSRDYKEPKCVELTSNQSQGQRVYSSEGSSVTLSSQGGGMGAKTGLCLVRPCLTPNRENKRQNGRRFKENGEPMFSLTAQDIHGIEIQSRIRKLTPVECFRLMGFQDNEINLEGLSDTQKYRLAGNGWDVNLVSKIFASMGLKA